MCFVCDFCVLLPTTCARKVPLLRPCYQYFVFIHWKNMAVARYKEKYGTRLATVCSVLCQYTKYNHWAELVNMKQSELIAPLRLTNNDCLRAFHNGSYYAVYSTGQRASCPATCPLCVRGEARLLLQFTADQSDAEPSMGVLRSSNLVPKLNNRWQRTQYTKDNLWIWQGRNNHLKRVFKIIWWLYCSQKSLVVLP